MLIYWLMFWFPFIGTITPRKMVGTQSAVIFILVCAAFAIVIGLRDAVGGDWPNYLPMFNYYSTENFTEILDSTDPGYALLNWSVERVGGGIYAVNLACAVLMMLGVCRFCLSLPDPWLALLVAVPYMLIVVGMGYTRQAVALGAVMYGLAYLGQGRTLPFVLCVVFGGTFHHSAVLLVPVAGLATSKNRIWTATWVALAFAAAYFVLLQPESENLWKNYVTDQGTFSSGAVQRALMNAVPAVLLLVLRKRFAQELQVRRLWIIFCWLALACLPFISLASTAVDRMGLYLLPLQLFVFSRMPDLTKQVVGRTAIVAGVVAYYGIVQYVWLNYAVMRNFWVPYGFMPFSD